MAVENIKIYNRARSFWNNSYLAKILINISIIGPIFLKKRYKMIKIVKNVLLAGDKFMPKKTTWIYL